MAVNWQTVFLGTIAFVMLTIALVFWQLYNKEQAKQRQKED